MKTTRLSIILIFVILSSLLAQSGQFIIVDQFGYPPDAKKIAVIKNPQIGFDANDSYIPGAVYQMIEVSSEESIYTGTPTAWQDGQTDESSGDQIWHFDFSDVNTPGSYYILDQETGYRSFEFDISETVYNNVLKQALRTFFYQRSGFAKQEPYAEEGWTDDASHVANGQDLDCRSFFDKNDRTSEKDLHGGWYDAGDYNKYTSWTASYVVDLMLAYLENPAAWCDDCNIPESGNGIPDLLDEAKWGLDHLMRLQLTNGSTLSIVGESHASPPSAAAGPSYYGKVNTSSTLSVSAAFALSSKVYRLVGMDEYADTLIDRAMLAWDWAQDNPNVLFNNNDSAYNSVGLGAGRQETDDYGRTMRKLRAACYLFEVTGDTQYRDHFDSHYRECHLIQWYFAYPFEIDNQETLLYYTTLDNATPSVINTIKSRYRSAMLNGSENLKAIDSLKDPYLAHMKDYTWGSNGIKSCQGLMYYDIINYDIDEASEAKAKDAALTYVNYLHGVNPLSLVYLSNMVDHGAEDCVMEFYHSWFTNGSELWDRAGVSTYGPPPGFLTGGPNPSYDRDGCCPQGCGSSFNNSMCYSESISPPKNQPKQKSYKDFNTSWPLNSWSVTENSCGYQVKYLRLLSKFVIADANDSNELDLDP